MLASLAIRNYVLIDRLEIEFGPGLCVLTGETGAGKSILLDALGLAIGARAESSATGRDAAARATVVATFEIADDHPARSRLADQDIDAPVGEPLVLRRTVSAEGRSRAFVNDQPVSVGALRSVGETLVEIEGQYARHGLLERANHRAALDSFGALGGRLDATRRAWDGMRSAESELAAAREEAERLERDADFLRHARGELAAIAPCKGEEEELARLRASMMNGEKIAEAVAQALSTLDGEDGIRDRLGRATRVLERANEQAAGGLADALAAFEETANAAAAAAEALSGARSGIERDPARLQELEDRLFALRGLARKHRTDVDSLPDLLESLSGRLAALESSGRDLERLEDRARREREGYDEKASDLGAGRRAAAGALDRAMAAELPTLQLGDARFLTAVSAGGSRGRDGTDEVGFEIASNPGQPPGPIARVASGGELARVLLALRVALFRTSPIGTLVFDEVDSGVGGATAAAVAERLCRLTDEAQVLVVTHSPQVAARGASHLAVRKTVDSAHAATEVSPLSAAERREEIARMLAGAEITDEARAAADRLMEAGRG